MWKGDVESGRSAVSQQAFLAGPLCWEPWSYWKRLLLLRFDRMIDLPSDCGVGVFTAEEPGVGSYEGWKCQQSISPFE